MWDTAKNFVKVEDVDMAPALLERRVSQESVVAGGSASSDGSIPYLSHFDEPSSSSRQTTGPSDHPGQRFPAMLELDVCGSQNALEPATPPPTGLDFNPYGHGWQLSHFSPKAIVPMRQAGGARADTAALMETASPAPGSHQGPLQWSEEVCLPLSRTQRLTLASHLGSRDCSA